VARPLGSATTHGNSHRRRRNQTNARGPSLAFTGQPPAPYRLVLDAKYTPNWPRANVRLALLGQPHGPIRHHPRVVDRHVDRARHDRTFLKGFGSRPEGRATADRLQSKALRWLKRVTTAANRAAAQPAA
jgi:hypothetical protein